MTTIGDIIDYLALNPMPQSFLPTFVVRGCDARYSELAASNREKLQLWCKAGGMCLAEGISEENENHPHELKYRVACKVASNVPKNLSYDLFLVDVDIVPVIGPHALKVDRITPRPDFPNAPFAHVNPNCRVLMAMDAHGLTAGAMLFRVRDGKLPLMNPEGWEIEEDSIDEPAPRFFKELLDAAKVGASYDSRLGEQGQVRDTLMRRVPNHDFGVLPEWVVANPSSEHTFRGNMSTTHVLYHHWESANRKTTL